MAWCVLETDDDELLSCRSGEAGADERGITPTCLVQQCMAWCHAGPVPLLLPVSRRLAQPRLPKVAAFVENTGPVEHLATSRNGQHVFCGLESGQVDVYHLASRKLCHTFAGPACGVNCMELSADGQILVTGSKDGSVNVWQVAPPALLFRNRTHHTAVLSVAVSPVSGFVVSGSRDGRFQVLDLDGGGLVHWEQLEGPVTSMSLNNCGTLLAIAHGCPRVLIWDLDDLIPLTSIDEGLSCPVQYVAITEDNTFLVAACEDNSLHVMSLTTGRALQRLSGHDGQVTCLHVCRGAVHALVGCLSGVMSVYNLRSGELLYDLRGHGQAITSLSTTRDVAFILSAAKDDVKIRPFYKPHDHSRVIPGGRSRGVTCLAVAPDRERLITGGGDSVVNLWTIDVCVTSADLEGHVGPITCVALARDEAFAVSGSDDKTVKIWNIFSSSVITNYKGHSSSVAHVYALDDKLHVLSADRSGRLRLWRAGDGVTVTSLSSVPCAMTMSPDEVHVAVLDRSAQGLQLWRVWEGVSRVTLSHSDKVTCVAFSPDGQHAVTGGTDKALRVWETHSGLLIQALSAHDSAVTCVAVSCPGPTHVVSGSCDGGLLVWCLATGRLLHRLVGHSAAISAVRTAGERSLGISGSLDGTVRVWGISQGVQLNVYALHAPVLDVQLTCSGSHVITKLEQHVDRPLLCFHLSTEESETSLNGKASPGTVTRPLLIPVQLSVSTVPVKGPRPRPIRLPTIPDIMQMSPQTYPFPLPDVDLQQENRKAEMSDSYSTTNNNRPSKDWMSTVCTVL